MDLAPVSGEGDLNVPSCRRLMMKLARYKLQIRVIGENKSCLEQNNTCFDLSQPWPMNGMASFRFSVAKKTGETNTKHLCVGKYRIDKGYRTTRTDCKNDFHTVNRDLNKYRIRIREGQTYFEARETA